MIITHFNKPVWNRHRLVTRIGLSILAVIVFIATRQPYAGIVCFEFLRRRTKVVIQQAEPMRLIDVLAPIIMSNFEKLLC